MQVSRGIDAKFIGRLLLSVYLPLFVGVVSASAQVTSGTILGTVSDSSGAPLPGVKITITNVQQNDSKEYTTDESGSYNAPFLIPGTYRVTAEKAGFKRAASADVILNVDDKARVDITLRVGDVKEVVEVTAISPLVRMESSELGEVIGEKSVRELPLNGRNFAQLVYLVPGVTPGQAGENLSGASTFNPRGASNFNALGSQANTNAWLVDGVDDNEYTFNTVMVQPSVESIGEFKVLTGTFSAEFGRGAGVVSVSTKSGTNNLHGSAFEFHRNSYLDARNYFNAKGQPQPPFRRNQFGASLGGPVVIPKLYNGRSRTFFFADYYGLRELKGLTNVNSVPTAAQRLGDFNSLTNASGAVVPIYNPFTTVITTDASGKSVATRSRFKCNGSTPITPNPDGTQTGGTDCNVIPGGPTGLINAVGLNVASIYPLPNLPGSFNNYVSAANRVVGDNGANIRVDHRIGASDSVFVRYSYEKYSLDAPQGQSQCCLPTPASAAGRFDLGPFVAGIQNTNLTAQGLAIDEAHVFSTRVVNEFIGGYSRTIPFTVQSDFGHNSATSLGIQGINVSQFTTGLPNLNIQDFTGLSGGPAFLPANPRQTNIQLSDSVSWTFGQHRTKFGFRWVRQQMSPFTNTNTRSSLNFNNNFTNNPAITSNPGGNGLATLLLGFSTGGTRGFLLRPYYLRNGEYAAFFQDDWKVSNRLTLNLGIRYDVFTADIETQNRIANFDFQSLRLIYAGVNGTSPTAGKSTQYGNVAPRLGFAYDFAGSGHTVIRGGYGISYFPEQQSASNLLGQNVPFTISQNYSPATSPRSDQMRSCTGTAFISCIPTIDNPFPPIAPVMPLSTADLNAANPSVIGHAFSNLTPYMESWNLDVERQLGANTVAEVAYAGSRGIHLMYCYNANEVQPGLASQSQASRRLIQPLANVSSILQCDPRNMSNYHSLQGKLTKRMSKGLLFLASYTFGKSLDYGGSAASGGGAVGNPQTITNLRAGYGPSGYDVKHRFVGSWVYELPLGPGKQWLKDGFISSALGGWQLAGITTLSTGRPFSVTLNQGVNNGAPSWPDRRCSGNLPNPDPAMWFDTTCFVAPTDIRYGNVGRGVLYGPGIVNWDLSLVKNTAIRERLRVQIRLDAFNAFNTPNFGFPNTAIGSPSGAGKITSTINDNRDLQLALRLEF
jgi:outer membrane receptor protein involved in Fe transport